MNPNKIFRILSTVFAISAVAVVLPNAAFAASTAPVIYSFQGGSDGEYADTDVVIDKAGNLYGTTVQGGDFGSGTVFQLSPSGSGWTHTVLYSFKGGLDGGEPYKGVTLDSHGNLYGTAVTGGSGSCEGGCGVVFKVANNGGVWTQSVIHAFTGGKDGYGPGSPVVFDKAGNIYGMVPTGGIYGSGVIFQLKPDQSGNWKLRVLHSFTGGIDGASGSAGRLLIRGGKVYGVATAGGTYGSGTAFEMAPTTVGEWKFKTLYAFKGQPDAGFPYGGLAADAAGNLYGTTYYDGANDLGSVYKLSNNNGAWSESVLYSFKGGTDGSSSISDLVFDKAGNFYGTTSEGGAGFGVIFKMSLNANGQWTESVAYRFQGAPDGAFAYNGMVSDGAGNLYGTTTHGGTTDDGAIFKFTP